MPYQSPGVYVKEVEPGSRPIEGVGTAVAGFVGLAEKGPANKPTLVANWSQFVDKFGGFMEGTYLAQAVYGYFLNGGGVCYIVRVGADGAKKVAQAELKSAQADDVIGYRVLARDPGPEGNELKIEVAPASQPAENTFDINIKRKDNVEESFPNVTSANTRQNLVSVIKAQSKLIQIEDVGRIPVAQRVPATGTFALTGGAASTPAPVTPDDYVGNTNDRTGFAGLETVDEVTMLAVPDLMAVYQQNIIDLEGVQEVQKKMIAHCELMGDRVAILDTPPGLDAQQVKQWLVEKANHDSKYAAMYWPWFSVGDPLNPKTPLLVPPSGHIAGIWARNDDDRGVHKAPANEVVRGAIGLELQLTTVEHTQLNPVGLNCIRSFPGRGIRVWGARTLSKDPAWRYLNVRRLFNYIEESLLQGTQWVVFEPNDLKLWQRVKRTINAFLLRTWRDGALFGATPEEAFYVKCDAETNPPESIDAGELTVEIGIAPVKPAEFVVIRIAQFSGGAAVSE